ncbi:hypothetical protein ACIKT0_11810 [Hansschlegelia beijingensis]|uniref:hypothetical protein n=1 Tax=Hansschlegelia beijingensis TaxID=1133344 RepID=UPI00387F13B0
MPSLIRFLTVLGVVGALGFSAVYALATFVTPRTREMVVTIPAARLRPPAPEAAVAHPRTAGAETSAADTTTR